MTKSKKSPNKKPPKKGQKPTREPVSKAKKRTTKTKKTKVQTVGLKKAKVFPQSKLSVNFLLKQPSTWAAAVFLLLVIPISAWLITEPEEEEREIRKVAQLEEPISLGNDCSPPPALSGCPPSGPSVCKLVPQHPQYRQSSDIYKCGYETFNCLPGMPNTPVCGADGIVYRNYCEMAAFDVDQHPTITDLSQCARYTGGNIPPLFDSNVNWNPETFTFTRNCDGSTTPNEHIYNDRNVTASDPDGNDFSINYNISGLPAGLTWIRSGEETFVIGGIRQADAGTGARARTYTVRVTAIDARGTTVAGSYDITVRIVQQQNCGSPPSVRVDNPNTDRTLSGVIGDNEAPFSWYFNDPDGDNLQLIVDLMDETCTTTRYRILTGSSASPYTTNRSMTVNTNSFDDGRYRLRVQVNDGSHPWQFDCSDSAFTIDNSSNQCCVITSRVGEDTPNSPSLFINTGQDWTYTVEASDPDGDAITYSSLDHPSWLNFSSPTYSGSTTTTGVYRVRAGADDGHHPTICSTQTFYITVAPSGDSPTEVQITQPTQTQDFIFSGADNLITWTITDPDGIQSISLYYSNDGWETQHVIVENLPGDTTSYNWDVSSLEPGEYEVMIRIVDNNGVVTQRIIGTFTVTAPTAEEDGNLPSIYNVLPLDESEITSRTPKIAADYRASTNGRQINTGKVSVKLDARDITSKVNIQEDGFEYTPEEELNLGRHEVEVTVEDSAGKKNTRKWSFVIKEQEVVTAEEEEKEEAEEEGYVIFGRRVSKSAALVIGALCGLAILILLVPWLLYMIWRRGEDEYEYAPEEGYGGTPEPGATTQPGEYSTTYGAEATSQQAQPYTPPAETPTTTPTHEQDQYGPSTETSTTDYTPKATTTEDTIPTDTMTPPKAEYPEPTRYSPDENLPGTGVHPGGPGQEYS